MIKSHKRSSKSRFLDPIFAACRVSRDTKRDVRTCRACRPAYSWFIQAGGSAARTFYARKEREEERAAFGSASLAWGLPCQADAGARCVNAAHSRQGGHDFFLFLPPHRGSSGAPSAGFRVSLAVVVDGRPCAPWLPLFSRAYKSRMGGTDMERHRRGWKETRLSKQRLVEFIAKAKRLSLSLFLFPFSSRRFYPLFPPVFLSSCSSPPGTLGRCPPRPLPPPPFDVFRYQSTIIAIMLRIISGAVPSRDETRVLNCRWWMLRGSW